ncbi:MAG: hypothetical protein ACRDP6_02085, partial [Actinoallomurus sp.]
VIAFTRSTRGLLGIMLRSDGGCKPLQEISLRLVQRHSPHKSGATASHPVDHVNVIDSGCTRRRTRVKPPYVG